MGVLITGATGLLGTRIVELCLQKDVRVKYLTTSKEKIVSKKNYKGYYWNPETNEIDTDCFKDVKVIIHLAGGTVSKRWTPSNKKEILDSRVISTRVLHRGIRSLPNHNVLQIISASGINIYPDSLTKYYNESETETDDSFLGDVVKAWEAEVDTFFGLNIKVAKVRIGLVLSNDGGAFPEFKKPTELGLGAVFGKGEQWQSWIHIDDVVRVFMYLLKYCGEGTFNAVAPNPVTQSELIKSIAKTMDKPMFLPNIPRVVMKLVLGEMHDLLFSSQRVSSKKIEEEGFVFKYPNLQPALLELLS
ncbi:NAD(P)-dependent epimerase/dehydratase [Formosa agariphila KMM 3901]|uniref:NAD(P)-dependent epimerase/dehydratase n=1 Tax=Formosa agariphila (strain DSM 15362 / KCTC 12365 / LMG 23005 / KMM 3901 / M-2Alg 35-1) TaxID=1347342 RepID=T2KI16_FORAG|nr:TIGR01777 family oxidoreductase [Formosa agariphila]CDF78440.1 NAD(P)-dependent epimerase/dehydratase [Formosa agariphila KMM 3901]